MYWTRYDVRDHPVDLGALDTLEGLLGLDVVLHLADNAGLAPPSGKNVGLHQRPVSPALHGVSDLGATGVVGQVLRHG